MAAEAVVAYVVMSHRAPRQVLRLLRALRRGGPGSLVVVHHDPRGEPLDEEALADLGGIERVRPARPVLWGWASQLDALLDSMRWALDRGDFDWLVVLSGQDYPARPLRAVAADLATNTFDGYIQGDVVAPPGLSRDAVDEFAARYHFRHRRTRPLGPAARRVLAAARPLLVTREMPWGTLLGHRTRTPFSAAHPCRRGQDWLTLSRRCVELLDEAARRRPALREHYRHVPMPTESYPHTVLHGLPGLRLSQDPRRFSVWDAGAPHPRVLDASDLAAIVASGADFARKLDLETRPALFDALDRVAGAR